MTGRRWTSVAIAGTLGAVVVGSGVFWLIKTGHRDGLANNSSLVLAIELSPHGRVLLFAGDAQIGNWLSWFGKVAYPNGESRGKDMVWTLEDGRRVDAKDLLAVLG